MTGVEIRQRQVEDDKLGQIRCVAMAARNRSQCRQFLRLPVQARADIERLHAAALAEQMHRSECELSRPPLARTPIVSWLLLFVMQIL